jgi:hypothetical protein
MKLGHLAKAVRDAVQPVGVEWIRIGPRVEIRMKGGNVTEKDFTRIVE